MDPRTKGGVGVVTESDIMQDNVETHETTTVENTEKLAILKFAAIQGAINQKQVKTRLDEVLVLVEIEEETKIKLTCVK